MRGCRICKLTGRFPPLLWGGMLWSVAGLVSCAIVLRHLKLILMFVCLNRLVIFRMCSEEKVKVARTYTYRCICFTNPTSVN